MLVEFIYEEDKVNGLTQSPQRWTWVTQTCAVLSSSTSLLCVPAQVIPPHMQLCMRKRLTQQIYMNLVVFDHTCDIVM